MFEDAARLAQLIDHTLVRPDATITDVAAACEEAKKYGFHCVVVSGSHVAQARELLSKTLVKVCAVVGFPHGASTTTVKIVEAMEAMKNGASELDIVINIGMMKSGRFDYVEIDQVLSNLIENAAKYAPAGTEIDVSAQRAGDDLRVDVADRGPGIPDAALPRVFEAFFRADTARTRARGQGVGLAVAKGLVEAHGGRIWAENRPGGGARFVFTLPLGEPPPAPAPSLPSARPIGAR